ncbi:MAG: hypothetical protein ABI843_07135 [Dokdonella sp.]
MKRFRGACIAVAFAALAFAAFAQDDDDDDKAAAKPGAPAQAPAQPALDKEQQGAVGIVVAHPQNAKPAQTIAAYGQVLDPAALVADAGQLDAARAAERAANADVTRLQALYRGEAGASLKVLQAAQAEQVHAHVQADTAAATFATRWGALAKMPSAQRQALIDEVAAGKRLLVRADLLGRRSLGELPTGARLDVDGMTVPARVLGALPQAAADLQSVGVLLQVDAAPTGFGAGARVPVTLEGAARVGVLIPASALIYAEDGSHVYKQLEAKTADGKLQYAAAKVFLLQPQGDAWLVGGIDDDDWIVVHGAGVLWSLQGVGAGAVDDDDD